MASGAITTKVLDNTLGAAFLGHSAETALFGVTTVQCILYYKRNGKDSPKLKSLIGMLWFMDSLHLALTTHAMYFYLINNYDNPSALKFPVWSICAQCSVTAATELLIRGVFAKRIWTLSDRNFALVCTLGGVSIFAFGAAVAYVVEACDVGTFEKVADLSWIIVASLASGMFADLLIAGSLVFLLWKLRTGFSSSVVSLIIIYSINTGVLTTICAILVIITYVTMPSSFVWLAFYFVLGKLNLNCLLAGLNSRSIFRDRAGGVRQVALSDLSHAVSEGTAVNSSTVRSPRSEKFPIARPQTPVEGIVDQTDDKPPFESQHYFEAV
ncbi:hypothetical protein PUNSTDRAFT_133835 [Punctularia strigosozonata HHB-11173 SS5]|uniref:uncharacterized protein n=1 Tax=Punctularia strigosozonata (strain HHB-11173) TaxID=741275 RepID=UPI00044166F9|nr:uncharacterized protein PUNSTDRAFT_133835 [Punctularia strigosozonata HHB-11173 SS5]EIN10069.1 hypothetical protein PUNSTDRAFT_133835 [Punctularia strigosozonata HHB-11173 SS5]